MVRGVAADENHAGSAVGYREAQQIFRQVCRIFGIACVEHDMREFYRSAVLFGGDGIAAASQEAETLAIGEGDKNVVPATKLRAFDRHAIDIGRSRTTGDGGNRRCIRDKRRAGDRCAYRLV